MEKEIEEHIKDIYGLAVKHQILDFNILFTKSISYDIEENEWEEDKKEPGIVGRYAPSNVKGQEAFVQELEKILKTPATDLNLLLMPQYSGYPFPALSKAVKVEDKKEVTKLGPAKGEVTLFHVWKAGYAPSVTPMVAQQELLQKHPEWKEKVKFVAISVDDKLEQAEQAIVKQGLSTHFHYWTPGGTNSEITKQYPQPLPFCVLTDSNQTVAFVGHPMEISLEDYIQKLVKGEKLEEKTDYCPIKDKKYVYDKFKNDLKQFVKDTEKEFKLVKDPFITATYTEKGTIDGTKEGYEAILEIRFNYTIKLKPAADKIKAEAVKAFKDKIYVKFSDEMNKTEVLNYGSNCSKCNKELNMFDQYLCVCCKPLVYFCTECVEKTVPQKPEDMVHPHPLYFIQKTSKVVLDEILISDLKIKEPKNSRTHNEYTCDLCSETPQGTHWKCANCEAVDLCQKCFEAGRKAEDPEIIENAKELGHDLQTHVCIREDFEGIYEIA